MRLTFNSRVQSMVVWSAYKAWCAVRGLDPVSHAMFGRLARWRKERIGGTVWYLDCELAEGYGDVVTPVKALPRLGAMAKAGHTEH